MDNNIANNTDSEDPDEVFKKCSEGIGLGEQKKTVKERLRKWFPKIREYRRKGYGWKALATIVGRPGIDIKVEGSTLRKLLGRRRKKTG